MSVSAHAMIEAERRRQIVEEGFSGRHDDLHIRGELMRAAICYLQHARGERSRFVVPLSWPWAGRWWKPQDARRDAVKAGALLLAEIERLGRAGLPAHHARHQYDQAVRFLDNVEGWNG